jgi:hypothetical protein
MKERGGNGMITLRYIKMGLREIGYEVGGWSKWLRILLNC